MRVVTGKFDNPQTHHEGWFRVFRFGNNVVEVWFGRNWILIER